MDNFTIIKMADRKEEIAIPPWMQKAPWPFYRFYLRKELPFCQRARSCYGIKGIEIILPFYYDSEKPSREFRIEYMERLIREKDLTDIYLDKKAREILEYPVEIRGPMLNYFMLPVLLDKWIMKRYNLEYHSIYPVVLDSGDRRVEFILEWLVPKVNHLAIATSRQEFFDSFVKEVYEEFGLVSELIDLKEEEEIKGNLILDCGEGNSWIYSRFSKEAIVVAPFLAQKEIGHIYTRRSDLKVFSDLKVKMNRELVDKELAVVILLSGNWKFRQFISRKGGFYYNPEGKALMQQYGLSIEEPAWECREGALVSSLTRRRL